METISTRVEIIKNIPLFKPLRSKSLNLLSSKLIEKRFVKGETIFLEGECSTGIFYVLHGYVKAYKGGDNGRHCTIAFFKAGDLFNEMGVSNNAVNVVSTVALEPTTILIFPFEALRYILKDDPSFALHLIDNLCLRINRLSMLVEDLSLKSVQGRLSAFLLQQADPEHPIIQRPGWMTQAEIAARLGTVTDVIQRNLRFFEANGLIKVSRSTIELTDWGGLQTLSGMHQPDKSRRQTNGSTLK